MYLVDTNIWLERLLDQKRSDEVKKFLDVTPSEHLYITDFAFHSLCTICIRLNQPDALVSFVHDTLIDGAVRLIRIKPNETQLLVEVIKRYRLDFDDAYQYVAAEQNNLTILSFDRDFDRTELGRKEPFEILRQNN